MATPFRRPQLDSSPLPSLDQILSQIKKPDVSQRPAESPRMFTTSSSFIRPETHPIDLVTPAREPIEPVDPEDEVVIVQIEPKALRKKRKKGSAKLLEWKPLPKPETPPTDDKPWRKYQGSASPESRTTKARGKAKQDKVVRSRHFKAAEEKEAPPPKPKTKSKPKASDEPLQLAPAGRRRADWTPPPPDQVVEVSSAASVANPTTIAAGQSFGSIVESYGRSGEEVEVQAVLGPGLVTEMLKKRKLTAAASTAAESRETSPIKKPAKKRKPRTITEAATAAYAVPVPEPEPEPAPPEQDVCEPKTRAKGARKPRPKKSKPPPPPEPVLLSPNAAIRQVYEQDFVFGTSSQLVLGDISPRPTKPRRTLMYIDEDPFASPVNSDAIEPEPKKKLWEVGARDEDGRLLDLPVIDLAGELDVDAMGLEIDPFGYVGEAKETGEEDTADLPEACASAPDESQSLLKAPVAARKAVAAPGPAACTPPNTIPTTQPAETAPSVACPPAEPRPRFDLYTDVQLAKEVATYGFKSIKRRTAMIALLEQCWDSKNGARAPLSPLPSNRSLSTAAAPAKAGPAAKKPRGRPKKAATTDVAEVDPTEPPPSGQAMPSPKRPRGRPRKDTTDQSAPTTPEKRPRAQAPRAKGRPVRPAVIEIPDSESEGPDLCLSSPELPFSSPPDVDVTLSLDDQTEGSLAVGTGSGQSSLMACITQAVRGAPPTKDPSQPSWHEKMLMYEPVILEDLAAWLNTGPLTGAGYDGEVSAAEVKQWCEAKSVCCLWRMNISGKERKRF